MKLYQIAAVLLVAAVALIFSAGTLAYYQELAHGICAHYVYADDSPVFVFVESLGYEGLRYISVVPEDTVSVTLTDGTYEYLLPDADGTVHAPPNTTVAVWRAQMDNIYISTHRFIVKIVGPHGNLSLPLLRPCIKPSGL